MPNIVRAIGQALVITPLTAIATLDIAPKDAANASGLFNMLRNLGGAVGTAALDTIITKREQFHSNIIGQSVTIYRDDVRQRIDQMTNYFMAHGVSDLAAAQHQAIVALGKTVKRQALVMGFSDTFAVIGVMLAIAAVVVLFARKGQGGSRRRRIDGAKIPAVNLAANDGPNLKRSKGGEDGSGFGLPSCCSLGGTSATRAPDPRPMPAAAGDGGDRQRVGEPGVRSRWDRDPLGRRPARHGALLTLPWDPRRAFHPGARCLALA